jgi:O-antigen/teichoic acid export membrane protein
MWRRIGTGFAAQLLSLAVAFADRILLVGVLIRAWGTDAYSDWATILAAAGLLSFGELGLNVYFGNRWQGAFARGDDVEFQRLIGVSLTSYLILGLMLASVATVFALMNDLSSLLSLSSPEASGAAVVFLLLAAANVLRVMRGSISQIYRGRGQFAEGILVATLPAAAAVVLAAAATHFGAGVAVVAFTHFAAELVFGCGAMMFDLRRRYPSLQFRLAYPTRSEIRDLLSNARWFALLQGAPVLWLQVPVLMISALGLSGEALVSFVVARTLVNFARQIGNMLSLSAGVEAANALHVGDKSALARHVSSFGGFLATLSGAVVGGLSAFGAPLITFWTARPETADPLLILWLLAPSILVVPALPLSAALTHGNFPRPTALASVVQLGAGLSLSGVLGHWFGVTGVAAGLSLGEALALGTVLPMVAAQYTGLAYNSYLFGCAKAFALALCWGGGVAWLLVTLIGTARLEPLLLSGAIWTLLGFVPVVGLALPRGGRMRVVKLLFQSSGV